MKKLDVILWLIVLVLTVFLIQGRLEIVELRIDNASIMKDARATGAGSRGGHLESKIRFRASNRKSTAEKRTDAEHLIADWLDLQNQAPTNSRDPAEELRMKLAKLDFLDRLRRIDPDHWGYVISELEAANSKDMNDVLNLMVNVNSRKLLDALLVSSTADPQWELKRQFLRNALESAAQKDPVGMIDWMIAHSDDYHKWIGEQGKFDFLMGVAKVDPKLALQSISKLGISDAQHQHALDQIFSHWDDSEPRMNKLDAIRALRKNLDDKNLDYDNAIASIIFDVDGDQGEYTKVVDFIESANFSQDELAMIAKQSAHYAYKGHTAEWIDWVNNLNISERARIDSLKGMMTRWVLKSPKEASNWMKMDSDMSLRQALLPRFLSVIKHHHPADFNDFIETMPDGEMRDRAKLYASERK